jgi:hypothetical protein
MPLTRLLLHRGLIFSPFPLPTLWLDSIIRRLSIQSVETGSITAVLAIAALIL